MAHGARWVNNPAFNLSVKPYNHVIITFTTSDLQNQNSLGNRFLLFMHSLHGWLWLHHSRFVLGYTYSIKRPALCRVFIRHWISENSPATTQNSLAKFRSFSERASLFHYNSPATLHYSPATTILFLMKTLPLLRDHFSKSREKNMVS